VCGPTRLNEVPRSNAPWSQRTPALDDLAQDHLHLLSTIVGTRSLVLELRRCTRVTVYCSFSHCANAHSSEDTEQRIRSFLLSITASAIPYPQNPQPVMLPW
ncbi:ASTER protein, partial [Crocuta crocuta]